MPLSSSRVFRDRNKLSPHYIPKRLPHRDRQTSLLDAVYGSMLDNIKKAYPRFTQIIGDTGTGKTCTTVKFGEQITEKAKREGVNL